MENRTKFYTKGAWCNDTCQQRYNHIVWALKAFQHGNIDNEELKFMIKNALVTTIYVSNEVVNDYPLSSVTKSLFGNNLYELYEKLVNNHKLSFFARPKQYSFFDICKLGDRISSINIKRKKQGQSLLPSINIEHTVPAEVYLTKIKDSYSNGTLRNDFLKIFNAVSICLVTKSEDTAINSRPQNGGKCLKTNMPDDANGNPFDFTNHTFARYDKNINGLGIGIDIYGWTISNGII